MGKFDISYSIQAWYETVFSATEPLILHVLSKKYSIIQKSEKNFPIIL